MAVEKLKHKECTKCGGRFPATTEYFYKEKVREDGLYPQCKFCKNAGNKLSKRKSKEKKKQHKPIESETHKEDIKAITRSSIDSIKQKYPEGKGLEIIVEGQRIYGRVVKHYKHFMTVKTKLYPTSILYTDILTGKVKIK